MCLVTSQLWGALLLVLLREQMVVRLSFFYVCRSEKSGLFVHGSELGLSSLEICSLFPPVFLLAPTPLGLKPSTLVGQ